MSMLVGSGQYSSSSHWCSVSLSHSDSYTKSRWRKTDFIISIYFLFFFFQKYKAFSLLEFWTCNYILVKMHLSKPTIHSNFLFACFVAYLRSILHVQIYSSAAFENTTEFFCFLIFLTELWLLFQECQWHKLLDWFHEKYIHNFCWQLFHFL